MNFRLHSADLKQPPYKELIESLVFQWIKAQLPAQELTYKDYQTALGTLLLTTQDPAQTKTIVDAVLIQATALGKNSAWVEQELQFEGMIVGVDRADFLRLELAQSPVLNDGLLDQYNERLNRFKLLNKEE